jgi:hypothetical protein
MNAVDTECATGDLSTEEQLLTFVLPGLADIRNRGGVEVAGPVAVRAPDSNLLGDGHSKFGRELDLVSWPQKPADEWRDADRAGTRQNARGCFAFMAHFGDAVTPRCREWRLA